MASAGELTVGDVVVRPRRGSAAWRALRNTDALHHGNFLVGGALVLVVLLCAVFADVVAPYLPVQTDALAALKPPRVAHWCGSDEFGRDILSLSKDAGRRTVSSTR